MCELLGMCFNREVSPWLSFRGFKKRGKDNPHGWGIGYYPDKSAQVIKEPLKSTESELAEFISQYSKKGKIKSKIIISHVRNASCGDISFKNTHPFKRELFGKEYIFAHNGNVEKQKIPETSIKIFNTVGSTDSEKIFCYLLNLFYDKKIKEWNENLFKWLFDILSEINTHGNLNLLFSDGEILFAYHDIKGYKGLYLLERRAPFFEIKLEDEDYTINLAEEKSEDQRGYIIATKPLTNENWSQFSPGELTIFKDGEILWSNKREIYKLTQVEKKILKTLRQSPHRLSLKEIIKRTGYSEDEVKKSISKLLTQKYIRQDSRDKVKWDNPSATFYTEENKRNLIDKMIKDSV